LPERRLKALSKSMPQGASEEKTELLILDEKGPLVNSLRVHFYSPPASHNYLQPRLEDFPLFKRRGLWRSKCRFYISLPWLRLSLKVVLRFYYLKMGK
jgi:hypothetical protein